MTTKQRILHISLDLFSVQGYDATSVRDIARAVGIKESSLYKHYRSKQDIFDSILSEMATSYRAAEAALGIRADDAAALAERCEKMDEQEFLSAMRGLFCYLLHDGDAAKFRRLLALEQYKNTEAAWLYRSLYFDDPLRFQAALFAHLLPGCDAQALARTFYAPIFFLLSRSDIDPGGEQRAIAALDEHLRAFRSAHLSADKPSPRGEST